MITVEPTLSCKLCGGKPGTSKESKNSVGIGTNKFVIRADCTPTGEHVRRFNAPTVNDVAAIIVGDLTKSRDIVVQRRSNIMHRVNETHRLNDALQYPIIYWQGQDGYDIMLKTVDPISGVTTNKNLSAMNYYAYPMMIRTHEENVILKCRRLFQQFAADMYVKVETKRLAFIRFNQAKLRSEDYIHLRDAIHSDGDVQNIGRLTILPSSYIGSPRHMHEYAQDAMTYVRNYGTPDLFITLTCNPKWTEIERELEPGQKPQDRHDIIGRVFQQKLKVMMDVLTKYQVFGDTRCYMYSVEWQQRGLTHAHILIWLLNKLHSNEVDDIISAEIPDPVTDPHLHDIVMTQMVHGPCGALNPISPCMADGKCTKRYPRPLVTEIVTGNDGYPVYRRRSKEDNGRTIKVKVQNQEIEIGNEFIEPYCPLLSRIFKTHANVESCHSAKSIKYLCKYVTKGSDMAVFGIASENTNDEISNFQMGRYLWNKYKDDICEDILHRLRIQTNNPDIQITDQIYNEGLMLIEDQCLTIANKLLIEVGMIAPNRSMHDAFNQELNRELQYNVDTLQEFVRNNVPLLNEQQKQVYKILMQAVDNNTGGLFFLDAPGGTGKTFVIIDFGHHSIKIENYQNHAWLSQRAILAAKNNDVHALNFTIQSKIASDLVTYKSVDSITNPDDVVNYPTEFLNPLELPGFPPHDLQLKVGTVIMILRNLNPTRLCNGTRLSVKRLMPNLIEATIINGKYAGENIQGQMYHLHGSMVPTPDEPHQFLQIYLISSMVDQLNVRSNIQGTQQLKRRIIEQLQSFLHANNAVVNMFKTALERTNLS
ncbi:uncharacterized protein [Bactrocera oleae]|uniref:uncharacterized protein n=1 Tax=Bactrocera oleae TaxID=104688 RepID=UPI00387E5D24